MARGRKPSPAGPKAPPPMSLVAAGVSKAIESNTLLAPVDVLVRPGNCVVLRGENGSGKTTLLRLAAGLTDPTTGEVTFDGRSVDERDPLIRRALAAYIGAPSGYRDLTLGDHLVLIAATWGLGSAGTDRYAQARETLASLEIEHLEDRFPHELSSGQQQLFHLACVLTRPSQVILLDEPEQRLDPHKRRLLSDLLVARKKAGTALLVACHDPAMTEWISDSVVDLAVA